MDLRIERTRKSIINAFIELRSKKPLEKITIKELAEAACINKATFYSHYHDIYDLSEQLEDEIISSTLRSIPHPDRIMTHPKEAIPEMTFALTAQNHLLSTLFSDSRQGIFAQKLERLLKEQIYTQYPEYKNNLKCDIILTVLIQGCFHAFISHPEDNPQEVVAILGDISDCLNQHFRPD